MFLYWCLSAVQPGGRGSSLLYPSRLLLCYGQLWFSWNTSDAAPPRLVTFTREVGEQCTPLLPTIRLNELLDPVVTSTLNFSFFAATSSTVSVAPFWKFLPFTVSVNFPAPERSQ